MRNTILVSLQYLSAYVLLWGNNPLALPTGPHIQSVISPFDGGCPFKRVVHSVMKMEARRARLMSLTFPLKPSCKCRHLSQCALPAIPLSSQLSPCLLIHSHRYLRSTWLHSLLKSKRCTKKARRHHCSFMTASTSAFHYFLTKAKYNFCHSCDKNIRAVVSCFIKLGVKVKEAFYSLIHCDIALIQRTHLQEISHRISTILTLESTIQGETDQAITSLNMQSSFL